MRRHVPAFVAAVVVLLLLGLLAWAILWTNRDPNHELSEIRPGTDAAELRNAELTRDAEVIEREPREAVSPKAEPGPPSETREPWLPIRDDISIEGMSGVEVAAYYWGDAWPRVRAAYESRNLIGPFLASYRGAPGSRLGDVRDLFDASRLVAGFKRYLEGIRLPEVLAQSVGGPNPFEPGDFLSELRSEALSLATSGGASAKIDFESEAVRIGEAALADRTRELAPLFEALHTRALEVIQEQMANVSPFEPPSVGMMSVSPVLNIGPILDSQVPRDRVWSAFYVTAVTTADVENNTFSAHYAFSLMDDPIAAGTIAQILELQASIESDGDALKQIYLAHVSYE